MSPFIVDRFLHSHLVVTRCGTFGKMVKEVDFMLVYAILFIIFDKIPLVAADLNSGCPTWGCLSSGCFSLSAGVPASSSGRVQWSTEVARVRGQQRLDNLRGCVSDQVAVVCSTPSGYVSLDLTSGQILWNTTQMEFPYLPLMDVHGDIIGMDRSHLVYVESSGLTFDSLDISVLQPHYSLKISNNSMLLLTSTNLEGAQIVTYNTDGLVCGAISLRGFVNAVSGTFIPAGHPIIVGYRAYVITRFIPDIKVKQDPGIQTHSLFAFDLWDLMTNRIKTVWNFTIQTSEYSGQNVSSGHYNSHKDRSSSPDPVVAYLGGTIYVNIPVDQPKGGHGQSDGGVLLGVRDDGDRPTFLFEKVAVYGQIVVYDTYKDLHRDQATRDPQNIWISQDKSPSICGYTADNGTLVGCLNITSLTGITNVTSKLAITRQTPASQDDVLVFGGLNLRGKAFLVALQTDIFVNAEVLMMTNLSGDDQNGTTLTAVGQIVNVAWSDSTSSNEDWKLGLVTMLLEQGDGNSALHIKAVV